jgi:hypothetical protein
MARRQQAVEMETVYKSRRPELEGMEFSSWQEAADAEDRVRKLSDPMGALDPIKQEEARQAQADAAARTAGDAAAAEYSKVAPAVATYKANKPLVEMEDKQAMDQIAAAGAARKANPITLDESSGWGGGPSMRSGSGADSVAKFAKIQKMSPQERERAVNEKFALPETTQEILARGDELNTSLRGKAVTDKAGGEDLRSVARSYNVPAYEQTSPAAAGVMKDIGAGEADESRQRNAEIAQSRIDAMGKKNAQVFADLTPQQQDMIQKIAERRAKGIEPPDQYQKDFPAMGKSGSLRAIIDNLTYEINPDFNAYEATLKYANDLSGTRAGSAAAASFDARNTLERQGLTARGSASTAQAKREEQLIGTAMEARATLAPLFDTKTRTWNTMGITPQIVTELALTTAKMLAQTGQPSEGVTKALQQGTAEEQFARLAGFWGAKTGGTTQQNLTNIAETIDRLGGQAMVSREYSTSGRQIPYQEIMPKEPVATPGDTAKPHPQDSEAIKWAKAHPNDPRAAKILAANRE